MSALLDTRCFNHAHREAAGRCTSCGRCFCRECVVSHDDRLLCATCLAAVAAGPRVLRFSWLRRLGRIARAALLLAVSWYAFFLLLHGLCDVPADFQDRPGHAIHGRRGHE
jgi:hypothetical protein